MNVNVQTKNILFLLVQLLNQITTSSFCCLRNVITLYLHPNSPVPAVTNLPFAFFSL